MKNWMLAAVLIPTVLLTVASCAKQENDDLAKAQKCLDNVPESNPTAADSCFAYAEKYTSQQANILKCSIKMTSGGLVESKVVAAYNALKDNSQTNKTAAYMAALSLDLPDVNAGYTKAVAANEYCKQSGVAGLIYISSIIVAGTYMNKVIATISGTPLDITNPASMNTAITTMLNSCNGATPDPACTADLPVLGQTVITVADSYCAKSNADQSVCSSVNAAVGTSGTPDPTEVGQALFCYLQGHTYDINAHTCH